MRLQKNNTLTLKLRKQQQPHFFSHHYIEKTTITLHLWYTLLLLELLLLRTMSDTTAKATLSDVVELGNGFFSAKETDKDGNTVDKIYLHIEGVHKDGDGMLCTGFFENLTMEAVTRLAPDDFIYAASSAYGAKMFNKAYESRTQPESPPTKGQNKGLGSPELNAMFRNRMDAIEVDVDNGDSKPSPNKEAQGRASCTCSRQESSSSSSQRHDSWRTSLLLDTQPPHETR